MWSFAVILWELYTREIPFGQCPPMKCGLMVNKILILIKKKVNENYVKLRSHLK